MSHTHTHTHSRARTHAHACRTSNIYVLMHFHFDKYLLFYYSARQGQTIFKCWASVLRGSGP